MIVGYAAGVDLFNDTEILTVLRFLQRKFAPLIRVRRRGTRVIRHSVERARAGTEINGGILLYQLPNVNDPCSQVTRRQKPVLSQLSLDTEIPRLRVGGLCVVLRIEEKAVQGIRRIRVECIRKWVTTRIAEPRIIETSWRRIDVDFRSPRTRGDGIDVILTLNKVVRQTI